jgi:hypothetical protein
VSVAVIALVKGVLTQAYGRSANVAKWEISRCSARASGSRGSRTKAGAELCAQLIVNLKPEVRSGQVYITRPKSRTMRAEGKTFESEQNEGAQMGNELDRNTIYQIQLTS